MRTPSVAALVLLAGIAPGALAQVTVTKLYQNGQQVPGVGPINSPFNPSQGNAVGATAFTGVSVNNNATLFATCNVYAGSPVNKAALSSLLGLTPYIAAGLIPPDVGGFGLPTADHAVLSFLGVDANNLDTPVFGVTLGEADFGNPVTPTSGTSFGRQAMTALEGSPVTAAGVAPGTVFGIFASPLSLGITDTNISLVGATIVENGTNRRALLKIATDGSGNVLSQTLVAKEGGPTGQGPTTWTSISIAPNSAAINNAGQVVFSAIASDGTQGVFRDGNLISQTGGSGPGGALWGALLGVPVDINASGDVAFRALVGDTIWTETGDAGDTFAGAQQTTDGTLATIVGSLADSHDVDLYRIRIDNYAAFSATTVPSPGFPGSAGDTVLYLFRDFGNANGITRIALARSDDAAAGTPQSTLGAGNIPPDTGNGAGNYYLAISTPKAQPVSTSGREFWLNDPTALAASNGKVYWSDPSDGSLRRADATTGQIDPAYAVAPTPAPYAGQIIGTGEMLGGAMTILDTGAGRFMYWPKSAFAVSQLRRADPDSPAPTIENILTGSASVGVGDVTGICAAAGKVFWTRADTFAADTRGMLNSTNADGSTFQILLPAAANRRPRHIAVDSTASFVYYADTTNGTINRFNTATPGTIETLFTGVTAGGLAVDHATGKLYWSVPASGIIERCNSNGSSREVFQTGLPQTPRAFFQASLAIDAGSLYYADTVNRKILKMPTSSLLPATTELVALGNPIGDRASDSPAHLDSFGSFARTGTASGPALPYQIRLTGASAFNGQAMVAKNGTTKVAAVGDSPAPISPAVFATVGSQTGPIRISDNGLVAYRATWGSNSGVLLSDQIVVTNTTQPINHSGQPMGAVDAGVNGFDMSDSGQHFALNTERSLPNFTGEYLVSVASFASVPEAPCPADWTEDGGVDGDDVIAFFADWDSNNADYNGDGGTDGDDVIAFFADWDAGC